MYRAFESHSSEGNFSILLAYDMTSSLLFTGPSLVHMFMPCMILVLFSFFNVHLFLREKVSGGGREGGRQNLKQALYCLHRATYGAQTHEP